MVENPPANAGDLGSISDPGRSHAAEQLNPCVTTAEPKVHRDLGAATTEPMSRYFSLEPQSLCSTRSHDSEKPQGHN